MGTPLRVLVAIAPPLRRIVEHLLADSAFHVVGRPRQPATLLREAWRRRPDVILLDARLLGTRSRPMLARLRRSSPTSKLVSVHSRYATPRRERWADARVAEDALVRRLLGALRRLRSSQRREAQRGL
jgi:DNA-binding response OmpR family regulator